MPHHPMKYTERIITLMMIIALILGTLFTGRGLYLLGIAEEKPNDLALRWREVKYVSSGTNPYDISDYLYRKENTLPLPARPARIDPQLGGTPVASGYPPWAFFWSFPFIPPVDWGYARAWFFGLNVISLAFLGIYAWRGTVSYSPMQRLFPVACVFSMNAIGTTLGNGQWGIILCALLAITSLTLRRGATTFPALIYATSLLKPTFGFTHAAVFLRGNSWRALLLAGLFTASSWLAVSWHVGIDPLGMLRQMLEQTARWNDVSYSIPDTLAAIGIPRNVAMLGCLVTGVVAAACILGVRPRGHLYELAVCATLARVFAYHQLYDNVLMVFLVIAIARLTLQRARTDDFAMLSALLVSVWIPGRFTSLFAIQSFQIVVWLYALGWLMKAVSEKDRNIHEMSSLPLSNSSTPNSYL